MNTINVTQPNSNATFISSGNNLNSDVGVSIRQFLGTQMEICHIAYFLLSQQSLDPKLLLVLAFTAGLGFER